MTGKDLLNALNEIDDELITSADLSGIRAEEGTDAPKVIRFEPADRNRAKEEASTRNRSGADDDRNRSGKPKARKRKTNRIAVFVSTAAAVCILALLTAGMMRNTKLWKSVTSAPAEVAAKTEVAEMEESALLPTAVTPQPTEAPTPTGVPADSSPNVPIAASEIAPDAVPSPAAASAQSVTGEVSDATAPPSGKQEKAVVKEPARKTKNDAAGGKAEEADPPFEIVTEDNNYAEVLKDAPALNDGIYEEAPQAEAGQEDLTGLPEEEAPFEVEFEDEAYFYPMEEGDGFPLELNEGGLIALARDGASKEAAFTSDEAEEELTAEDDGVEEALLADEADEAEAMPLEAEEALALADGGEIGAEAAEDLTGAMVRSGSPLTGLALSAEDSRAGRRLGFGAPDSDVDLSGDYEDLGEIEEVLGFGIDSPDEIDGSESDFVQIIDGRILEVGYLNDQGLWDLYVRKTKAGSDIGGDDGSDLPKTREEVDGVTVTLKGKEEESVSYAYWEKDGYLYTLLAEEHPLEKGQVLELVQSVK